MPWIQQAPAVHHSPRFRSPAHFLLPRRRPQLASLLLLLTLLQLALPEVAANHRAAVLINAVGEVLTGHADHASLPPLQVSIVHKIPLLHDPL